MQVGLRELARAEARVEAGGRAGPASLEILANIDAMALAIDDAGTAGRAAVADIQAIHARLMAGAINGQRIAGAILTTQNRIGGNDWTSCGAEFVPPPPEEVPRLMADLCGAINDDRLPALRRRQRPDGAGTDPCRAPAPRRGTPLCPAGECGAGRGAPALHGRADGIPGGGDRRMDRALRRRGAPGGAAGVGMPGRGGAADRDLA
jgi:hypothetical protein